MISKHEITIKYPRPDHPNTRHIADLKVDENGVVWASSTYDGSEVGPFESAVYILGVLRVSETSGVKFEETPSGQGFGLFEGKKVEAIELVPGPDGGIAFSAENENEGGWLYFK